MIDGLKPVQRMYVYSSIVNSSKEYKKVSAIAGIVSDYGYNHGETSAAGAGCLMAAEWSNNVRLVEGRGSFGTRMVPQAGAARYVYTRLHSNFSKYIKDIEHSPVHEDPEHLPPAYYIPTIPLVLTNGTKGIATGFATNILPRSEKTLIKACTEYVNTGDIKKRLDISYPDFKGTVERIDVSKYIIKGVYNKVGKSKLLITEIPYGIDRVSYIDILNKLEDDGAIIGYEDQCSTNGFQFEVKLKGAVSGKWSDTKIRSQFKLDKPVTENLTVIDENGKLKEYIDERNLIADFCEYRYTVLRKRIDAQLENITEEVRWLKVKSEFIGAVLNSDIEFKNKTKDVVIKSILKTTSATDTDCDRLLRLNIMSLTKELVTQLKHHIADKKEEYKYWKNTTPIEQFSEDLNLI
jgi:DNA topoisomerase-2